MATIKYTPPRGEAHHFAEATEAQVARAKRMLVDAKRVEVLAPGELDRVSKECGIPLAALRHIHAGARWKHVAPAERETA